MTTAAPSVKTMALKEIKAGENVRDLDKDHVEGLADSMKLIGVIVPLVVTPDGDLVAGFHRHAAATMAGLSEVPVIVRDSEGSHTDAAVENVVRKPLTPYEEAVALQRALDAGLTEEGAATALHWDAARVTARQRILQLPEQLQPLVGDTIPLGAVSFIVGVMELQPRLRPLLAEVLSEDDRAADSLYRSPVWFLEQLSYTQAAKDHDVLILEIDNFTVRDLEQMGVAKSKLRKPARTVYDGIMASLKQDWERGPSIPFLPEQIDHARALGCLLEVTIRETPHYLLIDGRKGEVLRELVNGALELFTPPEPERKKKSAGGAAPRTPEQEKELRIRTERNRMKDSIASAHAAQKIRLLDSMADVEVDMDVARVFVYGLFGRGYIDRHHTGGDGPGVNWWAKGLAGLLSPVWEPQPAKSNGGKRPDKLRYPLLQPKDDEAGAVKERRLNELWKFLDGAKTPGELFGRALCVIAGAELVIPEVLPTSRRWGTMLKTGGEYGYAVRRQAPESHDDKAAKALDRLMKKYKVQAPELTAAVKAFKAVK